MIHATQFEQQLGGGVEARADPVQCGGDVFAQVGPVGAIAVEVDFIGLGEQAVFRVHYNGHDFVGNLAL